jgi:transposase
MTRTAVLSDEMWARIEALLPPLKAPMGRPMRDHRLLVEAAVYRYRAGIPWRDLPEQFGPWQTAWQRHNRFAKDGTWDRVLTVLLAEADAEGEIDWRVSVDSTVVRAHQHSATARRSTTTPTSHTGGATE